MRPSGTILNGPRLVKNPALPGGIFQSEWSTSTESMRMAQRAEATQNNNPVPIANKNLVSMTVESIMTAPFITIDSKRSPHEAQELMANFKCPPFNRPRRRNRYRLGIDSRSSGVL